MIASSVQRPQIWENKISENNRKDEKQQQLVIAATNFYVAIKEKLELESHKANVSVIIEKNVLISVEIRDVVLKYLHDVIHIPNFDIPEDSRIKFCQQILAIFLFDSSDSPYSKPFLEFIEHKKE